MGYAEDGKQIMNNLVLGTGIGASATGLYYLAKKLRKRFEEQLERNKPISPDYQDVALEVPTLPAPAQKKLAFDAYTVATPLAGGAAGAILAAALSDKKTKLRNALLGGVAGAGAGAALNTKPVHEAIAKSLPTHWFPYLNMGGSSGRSHAYGGWKTIAGIGGGAAGLAGGKALYDISAAPYIEAEKKKEQYGEVESARKKYFDELLKDDSDDGKKNKEKKSSVTDLLDVAYSNYAEKKASWLDVINPMTYLGAPGKVLDLYSLGIAGASTGGALLGGKYMYDKTMAASKAKNMAKALAAKDRMKNTAPVWVDPRELAAVTDAAKAKETQNDEGV